MTEEEFEKLKPGDRATLLPCDEAKKAVRGTFYDCDDSIYGISEITWETIRRTNEIAGKNDIIEILARNNKTIAKRGRKVGIAIRSPQDKPDEAKGIIIAVARLYGYDVVTDGESEIELASKEKIDADAKTFFRKLCLRGRNPLPAAKDRVIRELSELEERIEKLSHAFAPLADKLGTETEAYSLLNLQLGAMRTYADILRRRLEIWKD